ncbi:long-chain-fatty-acid--CoA ligase [Sphingomonas sp. S2-65]|uniref:long-chain-fatty-acid--CoA ligase n=1 Tax=Sphingomonas sp. S2-65 TaxID=2903960 RepID=UPI001F3D7608|nr:long-chain fatty acid--CoA ligase [Sphingomonas sp. S2-65]UYY60350.1 long-chain fatty acid--CoA ligase [Sphingomonas sp. S2-65]
MINAEEAWRTAYRHPGVWDDPFPPVSMIELFEQSARDHPQAPLLDFMGRRYTYGKVSSAVDRVACGLRKLGYGPGDRIGLFLPNVPHYVAAYYGILKLGGTVVNFSPLYTVDELAEQVADSGTKLLFTISATALLPSALKVLEKSGLERLVVGSVAGGLPATKSLLYRLFKGKEVTPRPADPRVLAFSRLIANEGSCEMPVLDPEHDVALIQYTGGTTGTPKGAVLTHQNLSANARQVARLDPEMGRTTDRILGVLPFFHVFANTCVLNRTVVTGGEIVMLPRFNAKQALAELRRTKPRSLPGVPTMYQALLDAPGMKPSDFSSLKFCISGGAPLPQQLKENFEEITGARIIEGYGLSESSGVVSANPYIELNKPGTIGQPIAGTRVRLVDKEDPTRPPPEGEPGEIVVSGPQIMKGYWNRPDADASVFVDDHWLRTGDVGLIDEDGYIRIVDRLKDMIAVGGFKVFPSQIEAVLYRNPAVKECLVLGLPDPYHGELPHAYVTLNEDSTVSGPELCLWLNAHLGKHERVSQVVVRDSLPKTMIGKLSRKDLFAEVMGR